MNALPVISVSVMAFGKPMGCATGKPVMGTAMVPPEYVPLSTGAAKGGGDYQTGSPRVTRTPGNGELRARGKSESERSASGPRSRVRLSREPKVLGAAVLARQRANETIVGRDVVEAALAKVDAELAALWRSVTAMTWVDLDALEQIQDAIAREAGRDPEELHDEVIRQSVDHALKTVYRIVLRQASDEWLVSRTSTMFKKTRSVGNLTASISEPGCADLELTEWPGIRDRYLRQIAIGIERVLTLCGRQDVRVRYSRTATGAQLAASWTP